MIIIIQEKTSQHTYCIKAVFSDENGNLPKDLRIPSVQVITKIHKPDNILELVQKAFAAGELFNQRRAAENRAKHNTALDY